MRRATLALALAASGCGDEDPWLSFTEHTAGGTATEHRFGAPAGSCTRLAADPQVADLSVIADGPDGEVFFRMRIAPLAASGSYRASSEAIASEPESPLECVGPCTKIYWENGGRQAHSHHELADCSVDATLEDGELRGSFSCADMPVDPTRRISLLDGRFVCDLRDE